MTRAEVLVDRLSEGAKALVSSLTDSPVVGSLNFWFDEYGACLFISAWRLDEVCWSPSIDNNFELPSEYDVFDKADKDELSETVSKFLAEFSRGLGQKCRLRQGFQWSVSCFDTPSFLAKGDKLDGLTDQEIFGNMDPGSLEKILAKTLDRALESRKITDKPLSAIKLSTDERPYVQLLYGEDGEDYEVYVSNDHAFGFALNTLALGRESGFAKFASSIAQQKLISIANRLASIELSYCFSNTIFPDREFDDLLIYQAVLK